MVGPVEISLLLIFGQNSLVSFPNQSRLLLFLISYAWIDLITIDMDEVIRKPWQVASCQPAESALVSGPLPTFSYGFNSLLCKYLKNAIMAKAVYSSLPYKQSLGTYSLVAAARGGGWGSPPEPTHIAPCQA